MRNVFPAEVRDLISGHPDVIEATALRVEDKDFGRGYQAFVVLSGAGHRGHHQNYVRDHLARYRFRAGDALSGLHATTW